MAAVCRDKSDVLYVNATVTSVNAQSTYTEADTSTDNIFNVKNQPTGNLHLDTCSLIYGYVS